MTLKQQQWRKFFEERLIPFLERQAPEDVVLIVEPAPEDGGRVPETPLGLNQCP